MLPALLLLYLGMISCVDKTKPGPQEQYLAHALDSIRHHSLYRDHYNFDSLSESLSFTISDNTSRDDLYTIIENAVRSIDRHSYVIRKEKWRQMKEGRNPEVINNPYPFYGKLINSKYGYISMDGFLGGDSIAANNYCDSLQRVIYSLYQQKPLAGLLTSGITPGVGRLQCLQV